jgi:hypothetical protein
MIEIISAIICLLVLTIIIFWFWTVSLRARIKRLVNLTAILTNSANSYRKELDSVNKWANTDAINKLRSDVQEGIELIRAQDRELMHYKKLLRASQDLNRSLKHRK